VNSDKGIEKKVQNIPENGSQKISISLGIFGIINFGAILDLPPM
jgi:hypothetical protein